MRTEMISRAVLIGAILFGLAGDAIGQTPYPKLWSTTFSGSYELAPGSTVIIDNRLGNVVVEGVGGSSLDVRAKLTVRGADDNAVLEAREAVRIHSNPTPRGRMIRTAGNEPGRRNWAARVDYQIRLPRNCNVAIKTVNSDFIQTVDITGTLQIQNFSGRIDITSPGTSAMSVDTTNGDIILRLKGEPKQESRLITINGDIQIFPRKNLSFQWIAESMNGRVSFDEALVRQVDRPSSSRHRWTVDVNRGGNRIYSSSMTGGLLLRALEEAPTEIHAREPRSQVKVAESEEILSLVSPMLLQRPGARNFAFQRNRVPDRLQFDTRLGNIAVVEVKDARLTTGAGEIVVGRATGDLEAVTLGGPINVGETFGSVDVETNAGDIYVSSANRGGHARTGGGNIRIGRSGGPLRLVSGGGDITVQEAGGNVYARTKSGDIRVFVPGPVKSLALDLGTTEGNVILNLPAGLAATVDATVITSESQSHSIQSDMAGLAIVRDVVGGNLRIRAQGLLNGGGPVLKIVVEQGNIELRQASVGVSPQLR